MGSRSSYTWPGQCWPPAHPRIMPRHHGSHSVGVEQTHGLLGPDLNHYRSDASLTPPSGSRSVTASPPRNSLTAEQRELKRQRDQARHNSKMQARGRRAGSGSSSVYSPPSHLSELVTGASSMPVYTTAPPQISLLTEPATSHYLPPFQSPVPDHHQPGMFQPQGHYPPPSYMAEYSYPPSSGPGLASHYGYVGTKGGGLSFTLLTFILQATNGSRSKHGHVPGSSRDGNGPTRRQRPSQSGDAESEAAMLGARVQWAAVFDVQQPSSSPTREIGTGDEIKLPQLRGRVYENDGTQRTPGSRQVQAEEGREVEGAGLVVSWRSRLWTAGNHHLDIGGGMLNKMACMEAMLLFQGGLGLLDCIASWRGQERHVSHGEGTVRFFSTNRGDIHTNGENHGFWCAFFGIYEDYDGLGRGRVWGRGWRATSCEGAAVGLETCASPLFFW